jgi:phosphoglycolate phosphatase
MQTARAAQMCPVGALWGFRDKEELLKDGAQHLISKPSEVLDLLNREGHSGMTIGAPQPQIRIFP